MNETDNLLKVMQKAAAQAAESMAPIIKAAQQAQMQNAELLKQRAELTRTLAPMIEAARRAQELTEKLRPPQSIIEMAQRQAALIDRFKPSPLILELVNRGNETAALFNRMRLPDSYVSQMAEAAIAAGKYRESILQTISPAFARVQESIRQLPERMRVALMALAEHGWFLDLDMPIPSIWELHRALETGEVQEAEQALADYYKGRLQEICRDLSVAYPHRTKFFHLAFTAHERGEYGAAIPLLLAQSNGIWVELTKAELFTKRNGRPASAGYIESLEANTTLSAMLYPLTQGLPISASAAERGDDFRGLNRHTVLHGESLDYDSELNSLKAISFLNYVAHVIKPAVERERRTAPKASSSDS